MNKYDDFIAQLDYKIVKNLSSDELVRYICRKKVLIIGSEKMELSEYVTLIGSIGTTITHVLDHFSNKKYKEVLCISNFYQDGKPIGVHDGGAYWHTDMSYKKENIVFTSLLAERLMKSNSDGCTYFISCEIDEYSMSDIHQGHSLLSRIQRTDLLKLNVFHKFGNRAYEMNHKGNVQELTDIQNISLDKNVSHPLFIRHPITGKICIYGVAATSYLVEGFSEEESYELLEYLFGWLRKYGQKYRHFHSKGDLVVWDNLSTLHCGPEIPGSSDYNDCRILYRMNVDYSHHCQ